MMRLTFFCFKLNFSQLKYFTFHQEFLFLLFRNLINEKNLFRIGDILLKLYVEDFKIKKIILLFDFTVNFNNFFMLNILFLKLFDVYFWIDSSNALYQSKILFFYVIIAHDLFSWLSSTWGKCTIFSSRMNFRFILSIKLRNILP
jgi:hypothetical protein